MDSRKQKREKFFGVFKSLWISLILASIVGGYFFLNSPLNIPPSFESYDALGWNLAQGKGFTFEDRGNPDEYGITSPYFFRTPGYPLLLAAIYRGFGHKVEYVYLLHILFHLLTVVLTFALTREYFESRIVSFSTILVALYPLTSIYIPTILPEPLATLLLVLSIWLFIRTKKSRNLFLAFFVGMIIAYLTLVRPIFAVFSIFCIGGAWLTKYHGKRFLLIALVLHLGFVIVWFPWVLRNYQVTKKFIPLSTELPYQFWIGSLSVGRYITRHWENPNYYYQMVMIKNRLPYFHDKPSSPSTIEVKIQNGLHLMPIRLLYRTRKHGTFNSVNLTPGDPDQYAELDRYTAQIPPVPPGSHIEYLLSFAHPDFSMTGFRHPPEKEKKYIIYADPDIFHRSKSLTETLATGKIPEKMQYHSKIFTPSPSLPGAGWIRIGNCGLNPEVASRESESPLLTSENFESSSRIFRVPAPQHDSRSFLSPSSQLKNKLPCIQGIGFTTWDREFRKNRVYNRLAWLNLKRDLWGYLSSSILRIPRLWLIVGTTDGNQAYQSSGSRLMYPLLTFGTSINLFLGVLGIILTWKRRKELWILWLPIIYLTLLHIPFHTEARYTVPARPFLLIFSAIALSILYSKAREILVKLFSPSK